MLEVSPGDCAERLFESTVGWIERQEWTRVNMGSALSPLLLLRIVRKLVGPTCMLTMGSPIRKQGERGHWQSVERLGTSKVTNKGVWVVFQTSI